MADVMSPEQRKRTMSRIRAQSKLENRITKALWAEGYRFRKNVRKLRGTPDIAIQKYKVVIFIDSCFWHVCPEHGNWPKSNQEFWNQKLARNMERDRSVDAHHYHDREWHIMRLWEHEFKNDFERSIKKIAEFIEAAKAEEGSRKK
ncbi:very short patch repair endonuclease [Salinicoccus hispanicus]|uniref:Very short patch repair endonuclease n=1 Tax=Salinicoccus hispanicus TaxID=157225 RepID=A0A6N8U118_9STAP|nr:very short patch repair endonuclease [Salinicoccus hispanicus]MXQ51908.1 DNA mismatch endonuclease Vsr [Salinicoccus hispanicus]